MMYNKIYFILLIIIFKCVSIAHAITSLNEYTNFKMYNVVFVQNWNNRLGIGSFPIEYDWAQKLEYLI